jgi:LysM repeat protein
MHDYPEHVDIPGCVEDNHLVLRIGLTMGSGLDETDHGRDSPMEIKKTSSTPFQQPTATSAAVETQKVGAAAETATSKAPAAKQPSTASKPDSYAKAPSAKPAPRGAKAKKASKESFKASTSKKPSGTEKAKDGAKGTHTVKKGETLSQIAKDTGVSLKALHEANPGVDPKKLQIGQKLNLPAAGKKPADAGKKPADVAKKPADVAKKPTDAAKKPADAGTKPAGAAKGEKPSQAVPGDELGSLSAKYESKPGGDPGSVSSGKDAGGVSYGSHQLATKTGTAQQFVDSLKDTHPDYYEALKGKKPGTEEFGKAWKDLAAKDPEGFGKAQKDFVDRTHYDKAKEHTEAAVPGLKFDERSKALKDVLYSTAVQHGPESNVFKKALAGKDVSKMSDADIIKAVYAERGKKNKDGELAYFSRETAKTQGNIANRFVNEQKDALDMLAKQQAAAAK